MKFLAVIALLVSISANAACPNLSGTYTTCRSSTGEVTTGSTISQTIANGVTTYKILSVDDETGVEVEETIIADGVLRTQSNSDDTGMTMTMTTKANCTADSLKYEVKVAIDNQEFANIQANVTKSGSQLKTVTTGTESSTVICE